MKIVHRFFLFGFLLLLFSGCGSSPNRSAGGSIPVYNQVPAGPTLAVKQAAIERGVTFLLQQQNEDGSWGGPANAEFLPQVRLAYGSSASFDTWRDATTALCIKALIPHMVERTDVADAVNRATTHLLQQPTSLRATPRLYYNVWSHAYILEAVCTILSTPTMASHHQAARKAGIAQIAELQRIQGGEGGFGYIDTQENAQPSGLGSTSFVTATVLYALAHAVEQGFTVPPIMFEEGRRCIARQRAASGNYVYSHSHIQHPRSVINQTPGAISRNPLCNLVLLHGDPQQEKVIQKNLTEFFYFHHFLEMALGRPGGDNPRRANDFTFHESWHGVAAYFFYFGHYYTAEAARTLPAAERQRCLDGQAAILCRLQNPDGSWWDFPTMYRYHPFYGTAFALMALAS